MSMTSLQLSKCQDYTKYLGLRRAITRADWTEARKLLNREEDAKTAIISEIKETALLVAVTVGKRSNDFVRGLIKSMPPAALAEQNSYGNTALHRAAMIGNRETAEMLLNKSPELLYISNNQDYLPVHIAAVYCHKGMLEDLIGFHQMLEEERATNGEDYSVFQKREDKSPFKRQLGASLLLGVITSQFIDVALKLVQKYPDMAILKDQSGADALYELARSNSIFESGAKFKYWWEKWIYSRILLTSSTNYITDNVGNLSSKDEPSKNFSWFGMLIYKIPFVKRIKDKKLLHQQALKLVKCVCGALESLPSPIYERALLLAAHNGIHEVVEGSGLDQLCVGTLGLVIGSDSVSETTLGCLGFSLRSDQICVLVIAGCWFSDSSCNDGVSVQRIDSDSRWDVIQMRERSEECIGFGCFPGFSAGRGVDPAGGAPEGG
ncbi:hypothetical protein F511_34131 [Dorcoceras hygrometricum]|uniref:Uncharacterized protein n=1 Tax=Dorcoceras hygrometricum TaxID=472368 RepID=A0A2Z7A943_9LAMI|nr:hypothetical protein F511_34131 [Dorcoceras hygrometricum]